MEHKKVTVGLIQMRCFREKEKSVARACELLEEAAAQGVEIACLPELFASDYFCKTEDAALFDLAEPIPGPTSERVAEVAKKTGMSIVCSLFEKRTSGLYHNTSILLSEQGEMVGRYRKMHIPDDPLFYEKFYFTPGDLGFQAFDTAQAKVGMLVCWDQWYPEAARLTALEGAELLFYPTAIGWLPADKAEYGEAMADMWQTVQRSHAVANGCFVAAVNRVGFESVIPYGEGIQESPTPLAGGAGGGHSGTLDGYDGKESHNIGEAKTQIQFGDLDRGKCPPLAPPASGVGKVLRDSVNRDDSASSGIEFWGGSFICDPYGRVLAKGSVDQEEVIVAQVDLGLIEDTRRHWPFLRDRRIDAYGGIIKRFGGE